MKKDEKKTTTPTKTSKTKIEKKEPKLVKAKIPSLFNKQYTLKKLEKKIYKRIYIPADKKFLKDLFKETGKNKKGIAVYSIPKDTLLEKKDQAKLKLLAKEIKSQKSRIRWVPLIAAVSTIALIVILFTTFKNIIIKKAITNTCENIFEAKCDIASVNFKLFDASFRLDGLQIANKDKPMKNLFSCDSIVFDFDLVELLKGHLVTDEIKVSGMNTDTDRTYSGDISAKIAAKKAKEKNKEDSAFVKEIKTRSNAAVDSIKNSVQGVFDEYNPQTIIQNCYANMECPTVAKQAEESAKVLIEKYKQKPQELETKINEVKTLVENCQKIDLNAIKTNPTKIKEAIETLDSTYKKVESLKKETENALADIKKDAGSVKTLSTQVQNSIAHDKKLISTEINKITSINIDDGKKFISGTLDGAAYQLLGKYYPYAMQLVDYLIEMKNSSSEKPKEPTEKEKLNSMIGKRAHGVDVFYKGNLPKFWLKKLIVSGFNFELTATNISSDMDLINQPAIGEFKITINSIDHTGTVTVDTRQNTTSPLVDLRYVCDKLPVSIPSSSFGTDNLAGIPSIEESLSTFDFDLAIYDSDGFNLTGKGTFNNMIITAAPFEPEFISTIYINTLKQMNSMMLEAQIGYRESKGINIDLSTDIDKQFIKALKAELKNQLSTLKKSLEQELSEKISDLTGGAITEIGSFEDIYATITDYNNTSNTFKNQIESKKKEAESYLNSKLDDVKDNAKKATKNYLQSLM